MPSLRAAAHTDIGRVRRENEDRLLCDEKALLFGVADGVGGLPGGAEAAQLAIEEVHGSLLALSAGREPDLVGIVQHTNHTVATLGQQISPNMGIGTTLTIGCVLGSLLKIAHVGDSRAYLLRDGRLERLTRDHTVVQQEIDAGRLTPELARVLPHRNILTQSVGFHGPVEPDTATTAVRSGDVFVLCTDGLTDALDDEALSNVLRGLQPDEMADALTEAALQAGAEDNITVAVVATGR